MGATVSTCTKLLALEHDMDYLVDDSCKAGGEELVQGPQLALRVCYSPIENNLGCKASTFQAGDEVGVMRLEKIKGWEPLGWRQERAAKQRAASEHGGKKMWPEGPRCAATRYWGAKVVASDGRGGFEEHWCMLQVHANHEDRHMENVKMVVDDAKDVASYAHSFNQATAKACGADVSDEVPGIKVLAPVGAYVIGSTVPDIGVGQAVTLSMYPYNAVKKFVFEGSEDFLELPQAFFHYVAWMSGGRELVADLQGMQDDEGVILTDPVLLRSDQPGIGDILGVIGVPGVGGKDEGARDEERFNLWHPRCGQLCKTFDPQRRSIHQRKNCGFGVPSCGVAGGA